MVRLNNKQRDYLTCVRGWLVKQPLNEVLVGGISNDDPSTIIRVDDAISLIDSSLLNDGYDNVVRVDLNRIGVKLNEWRGPTVYDSQTFKRNRIFSPPKPFTGGVLIPI